jgi:hypothetical protein
VPRQDQHRGAEPQCRRLRGQMAQEVEGRRDLARAGEMVLEVDPNWKLDLTPAWPVDQRILAVRLGSQQPCSLAACPPAGNGRAVVPPSQHISIGRPVNNPHQTRRVLRASRGDLFQGRPPSRTKLVSPLSRPRGKARRYRRCCGNYTRPILPLCGS